jgi:hypothetical protein
MAYINQDFLSSPEHQRSIRNDVLSILDETNIQPMWHPMHDAFWYTLIKPAVDIRKRLDALNPECNPDVSDWDPSTGKLSGRSQRRSGRVVWRI